MKFRMATAVCGVALVLTTAAAAQDVTGIVSHIDASTRTVYFTDGRIVHVKPNATLTVDGKTVTLEQLARGTTVSVKTTAAGAPGAQTTDPNVLASHPPIDATGKVARVDTQTGIITLQDGRMLKATGHTRVWQAAPMSTLESGDTVFITGGQPIATREGGGATGSRMGTVMQVDPANALVMLSDGTMIRITPATKMSMGSQRLTISELQRGDEVLIRVKQQPSATSGQASTASAGTSQSKADGDGPSALPRQGFFRGSIDAEDVQVLFRHQAGG